MLSLFSGVPASLFRESNDSSNKQRCWINGSAYRELTVPAALSELEKIEMIRMTDGRYRMDHSVTATQKTILGTFWCLTP